MDEDADTGVGYGEHGRPDQFGIDVDDTCGDQEQGPSERSHDQRDEPPSSEDHTEQNHRRNHLDPLPLQSTPGRVELERLVYRWRLDAVLALGDYLDELA